MARDDTKEVKRFRILSQQIDDLYSNGSEEEAIELLNKSLKEAKGKNEAYSLFFEGELQGYIHKDLAKTN